jgi:acetyl-CoA carboxylase biotin carboxyl carrier protein
MKLSEIQELIKFVARAGVNEVEIEQKDFKILIKSDYLAKKKSNIKEEPQIIQQQVPVPMPQAVQAAPAPVATAPVSATVEIKETAAPEKNEEANYITVKSQMIGTFYRSSSPDKPAFVSVGDTIKEGDPICIVEAMKLFNEIESEVSGKIVKVLVEDATPVEFDQPLFLVDPS